MVTIKAVTVRGRMREAAKGSRGATPLLGLTMGWLLDRTLGSDPCIKDRPGPRVRPTLN